MAESTFSFSVLSDAEISRRVEDGLMAPLNADSGMEIVDCGDTRPLTEELAAVRFARYKYNVIPGRLYGAANGIANVVLISLAAQEGEEFVQKMAKEMSPIDMPVHIAAIASDNAAGLGIELTTHSAAINEKNNLDIMPFEELGQNPLGCKANHLAGAIFYTAGEVMTLERAKVLQHYGGVYTPLKIANDGAHAVSKVLTPDYRVTRQALHTHALQTPYRTPTAILKELPRNAAPGIVFDLTGYRSDAGAHVEAGIPRFHHTPEIAKLAVQLWQEHKIEEDIAYAAGILLGVATNQHLQKALGPMALEIIAG